MDYDAIVVGSGATGGVAAKELCERGFAVLVLEAGPAVREPRADPDWQARRQIQSRHPACTAETHHLFVDDVENPYTAAAPFDWIRGRQVGGRSLMWGGLMVRMSDYDFKCASHDGFGVDWPIAYRDLAPYYADIERFVGVTGTREGLAALPDGVYAAAPEMTDGERVLKRAVEARWPERHVISGRAVDGDRKTSIGSSLAAARATGRMALRSDAIVERISIEQGRAIGVVVGDSILPAKLIVLCASTIESVRILWNSGIGNSTDQLGRYLMDHTRVGVIGECPELTGELGPTFGGSNSIYIPRFVNLETREPGMLRGYQMFGGVRRHGMRAGFALSIQGEQLPVATNRVTIDRTTTDACGIPVPHIDCRLGDNERALAVHGLARAREMIAAAKFEVTAEFAELANPGWLIHEVGGARMGTDPRASVVDEYNRVWDCPNVLVTDGACWVSCGCQNPTLTMMALTARACREVEL